MDLYFDCNAVTYNLIQCGVGGTYIALFSQSSHSKGFPVTSLRFTEFFVCCFQWLEKYCKKLGEFKVFEENTPNHVLVNEYLPGQGIMVNLEEYL